MNYEHLHLLLNHFPILGTMIGCGLFLASFFKKSEDLRRSSLIVLATMALIALPTFFSGFGAADQIGQRFPGVSKELIARHEGAAMLSIWFMEFTGALALIGLWQSHKLARVARWNVGAILVFSLLTVGLMARTGNTGGDIRHPEDYPAGQATPTDGAMGTLIHHFEPNPQGFIDAMSYNKMVSWALMAPHFLGLALIIGTVGILDLRIMGLCKQFPAAPVHQFIPWALAGLAVNVVTGILAFIGQWYIYIYSYPFWLKMLALLLLGGNAAAFYMTDVFPGIEHLKAGEDAPRTAKLVAASSLLLWFLVITFGRYIQPLSNTIHPY